MGRGAGPVGRVGWVGQQAPFLTAAGPFHHRRDGRQGVGLGRVVMRPDLGVTLTRPGLDPPGLVQPQPDVAAGEPAPPSVPPATEQLYDPRVERTFEQIKKATARAAGRLDQNKADSATLG